MDLNERIPLLKDLQSLQHREAENVDSLRTFLPLSSHRLALRREIVVVRGGRGAGKSHLFKALQELERHDADENARKRFFQDDRSEAGTWVDAFSQLGLDHPEVTALDEFGRHSDMIDLRLFWIGHLVRVLHSKGKLDPSVAPGEVVQKLLSIPLTNLASWIPAARENPGQLTAALDTVERRLEAEGEILFATYDHLDRIGSFDAEIRASYVGSLLAMWLSFSNRYRHLRGKIFLREDLFEQGEVRFPDATKLRPRSVSLEWSREELYRVVVRHLASASSPMRSWLGFTEGLHLENLGEWGWMPSQMPEDTQKSFADRIAGELMGKGVRKGYTYRWIPNHLQDARGSIVPRSMLALFGNAAEKALENPLRKGSRLLEPRNLRSALEKTSQMRVAEIREEYPLVERIENLRGQTVLMTREPAVRLLGARRVDEPQGLPDDGVAVFNELHSLGVLKTRPDGRVDVPDIYRYGYGIKRKGGVAVAK